MKKIEELKRALIIKRAELWVMWSQIRIREREEIQLVAAIKALELKEKGSAPGDGRISTSLDLSSLDEAALERYRVGKQEASETKEGVDIVDTEDDSHGNG